MRILADSTTVNLATALGFFSRMCRRESLEMLDSDHHLVECGVVAWSVVMVQNHTKGRKIGFDAVLGFPVSEAYSEKTRELSDEARPRSIQKESKLGPAAENRDEQVGVAKPTRANVGEFASGVLRKRDKGTLICPTPDGEQFTWTERQLLFTWCLAEVAMKDLNSCDKMKYGDKILHVYQIMLQYFASCNTWINIRASGNKSLMVPLRKDSRGTLLVLGG